MKKRTLFLDVFSTIAFAAVSTFFPTFLPERIPLCVKNCICIVFYIIVASLIFFLNYVLVITPVLRPYKKYEGIWIEIIPNSSRKLSICQLKYDRKNGYIFSGTNYPYTTSNSKFVEFTSVQFSPNGNDSFYYIDKPFNNKNVQGYGKIESIYKCDDNYYKASGYFLDVQSESPTYFKTELIRFEKAFWEKYVTSYPGNNPIKEQKETIYKDVRSFCEQYLFDNYPEVMNHEQGDC